ncbi:MAG: hypothetical protein K2Z81_24095 [Cyanobacteria bacterium]|nr:hypothetical protein [Cyanobacteriota bacterium]
MRYEIFGPFTIPRNESGLVDRDAEAQRDFWDNVVGLADEGLPVACGCYVFAVAAAKGIVPWYVGLTEKRTFRKECLGAHQVGNYNDVLAAKGKARPLLYLLAKRTPTGRLVKPSKNKQADIQFLETYLIGHGLNKNSKLLNQKKTKFLKSMHVPSVLNSSKGPPGIPAKSLQVALGL